MLAECRGGELLREIERHEEASKAASHDVTRFYTDELESLNLNRMMTWRWQVMSYVP